MIDQIPYRIQGEILTHMAMIEPVPYIIQGEI